AGQCGRRQVYEGGRASQVPPRFAFAAPAAGETQGRAVARLADASDDGFPGRILAGFYRLSFRRVGLSALVGLGIRTQAPALAVRSLGFRDTGPRSWTARVMHPKPFAEIPNRKAGSRRTSMKLKGFAAIEFAEKEGYTLNKAASHIDEAQSGLSIAEAEAIA